MDMENIFIKFKLINMISDIKPDWKKNKYINIKLYIYLKNLFLTIFLIITGTLFFIVDILYDKKKNATIIIKSIKIAQ